MQTDVITPAGPSRTELRSDHPYRLSRHLNLRPLEGGGLVAESLSSGIACRLTNPTQIMLALRFLEPTKPGDLLEGVDEERRSALTSFFSHLYSKGVLELTDGDGPSPETPPGLENWEPHDLFFHLRSRRGRTPHMVGADLEAAWAEPPEPPFKTLDRPLTVKLPKGDGVCGLSLTEALESRRSLYSTAPLSLDQLGEFLYRTSRITGTLDAGSETLLRRPYPSGGGFHSLEAYIVATRCKGLEPGMYHYRPLEHGLVSIASPGPRVEKLLEEARIGTGRLDRAPSVLIVLAARFRRVSRKYRGLVYSLILKEVGAAFQTFYLVATEMGLAPCAIGTGNSEAFCQAAGVEFFQESSVGEFILGGAEP